MKLWVESIDTESLQCVYKLCYLVMGLVQGWSKGGGRDSSEVGTTRSSWLIFRLTTRRLVDCKVNWVPHEV